MPALRPSRPLSLECAVLGFQVLTVRANQNASLVGTPQRNNNREIKRGNKMPTWGQFVTLFGVAGAAVIPMAEHMPQPYAMLLTSFVTFVGAVYHLYQVL